MNSTPLVADAQRRREVRRRGLNGISDVEVAAGLRELSVRLFKRPAAHLVPHNVRVDGGERIRAIDVLSVRQEPDEEEGAPLFTVVLDKAGDYSTYTLRLVEAGDAGPTDIALAGFDPLCAHFEFRFREAHADLDCRSAPSKRPEARPEPDINYLARDYASFRKLITDRLSLLMPQWQESHLPDVGVAIVDLLAYVGDHLSYHQDAVATEAYLSTARKRISVRRHARLVDYRVHEGCNARTWVQVSTGSDFTLESAHDVRFVSDWAANQPPSMQVLREEDLADIPASAYLSFSPVSAAALHCYAEHSEIGLHDWGLESFQLPQGSTHATLRDGWDGPAAEPAPATRTPPPRGGTASYAVKDPVPARQRRLRHLAAGDFLLFQEVRSPATGQAADADAARRHVVRLTQVIPDIDPVYEQPIVHVAWDVADALPFTLTVSAVGPSPECMALGPGARHPSNLSVACGNIVLVDHGALVSSEVLDGCVPLVQSTQCCTSAGQASDVFVQAGKFRAALKKAPITFRSAVDKHAPASTLLIQDPRAGAPQVWLSAIPGLSDGSGPLFHPADLHDSSALAKALSTALNSHGQAPSAAHDLLTRLKPATFRLLRQFDPEGPKSADIVKALQADLLHLLQRWQVKPDLLQSTAQDLHCTAEIDDEGVAHLRFGDGDCGMAPEAGAQFLANYRIGCGTAGNAGAGTLMHMVLRSGTISAVVTITQPFPAVGGVEPEPMQDVKLQAPMASHSTLERAITADDYAALAQANPKVQRAAATLRWNGSRYLVRVAIDPLGTDRPPPLLLEQLASELTGYRRIGHDVEVVPARYVPLDIAMTVGVLPNAHAHEVKVAVLAVFSTGMLADGSRGVFHPDNLSFGTSIELSRLVTAAQRVAGVESVTVDRLERLHLGPNSEIENGVLPLGPLEIPQVDGDPNFPERGRFKLRTRGGR